MDNANPVFDDEPNPPPPLPDGPYDEEPKQEPPGSFLGALPQFFVFPLILVATLTAVYLLLRMLAGVEDQDVPSLVRELRTAGPHARWQVLHSLATGLDRGTMTLDEVPPEELEALFDELVERESSPTDRARLTQFLLKVVAYAEDPRFTPRALAALDSPDRDLRHAALGALGIMGDPVALPALRQRLDGEDADERHLALAAIAQLDTPEVHDVLAGLLRADDSVVARNAALLLAREPHRDPAVKPFLLNMLDRDAYASDPSLDGPMRGLMDDASREAARADVVDMFLEQACRAASEFGDLDAVPRLENLREADPSLKVRSAAIDALHELGAS